MAKKEQQKRIEFYLDGKLYGSFPYNKWDNELDKLKKVLAKKGYVRLYGDEWNKTDDVWYGNKEKKTLLVYQYRICTGYKDKSGHMLYQDDFVTDGSLESRLLGKPFEEDQYYIRRDRGWMSWTDTDINNADEASRLKKLSDACFGKNKKMWDVDKIERFDGSKL